MKIRKSNMEAAIHGANAAKEYPSFDDLPIIIQREIEEIMSYLERGGIFSAEEAPTAWWALEIQGLNLCDDPPTFAKGGIYQFYYRADAHKYAIWHMNSPNHAEVFGHDIVDVYNREEEEEC